MPPPPNTLEIVEMLIRATQNGRVTWESESDDGDAFRATIGPGGARVSRVIPFQAQGGGPLLFELLDEKGRTILQHRPMTAEDTPIIQTLFTLARQQALDLGRVLPALVEEIRNLSRG